MIANTQQNLIWELRQPDIEKPVKQLYDHYFEGIVAQVCANSGTREDGADIFQEAVLVLVEKVKNGQFRGDSSIKTFLSAIARNRWLFELRTRDRRKKRETFYSSGEDTVTNEGSHFFNNESIQDLEKALAQLGDVCRKILTGYYYEDKSIKELLEEFDYENEQVLRNRKCKCMKKLKELLSTNTTLLENLKPHPLYD